MRLNASHPALTEARTIHPTRRRSPSSGKVVKPVNLNSKLGKGSGTITKGKWRGMPMFSVTLEERATCPTDCLRWAECYGNGMPFAHRFQHGPELEAKIASEIAELAAIYPNGIVIRLHILGDFYSVEYVHLWLNLLTKYPNLRVFGYTARHTGPIANAIKATRLLNPDRFWIRFSRNSKDSGYDIFASQEGTVLGAITCPEQTGKSKSCLGCGLCWSVNNTIAFVDHDKLNKQRKANEPRNPAQAIGPA